MVKFLKGPKFSWAVLTFFVGLLLIWFSYGGKRDPELTGKKDKLAVRDSEHGPDKHETHSNGRLPAIEREPEARGSTGAIEAFEDWMERYFKTDPAERDQLTGEGVTLAQWRRSELKSLIQEDAEAALATAIPYELRRELPAAIVEHLETPVSDYASFELLVYCLDPDHGPGHSEEDYERLATIGESRYEVSTYGRRLNVTTKERLSIHGMAIDEILAMGEDPIRLLSEEERLERGFNSPRVVAVGNDYYEWADAAALNRLRQYLQLDEEAPGPRPGAWHWELLRGELEGLSLLLTEDTVGLPEEVELPELQSPHTEGPKTMLYIRARFSDQEANHEPIDLATLRERQADCEAFWYENSYGKSSLTTTFTDTITLPNPALHYRLKGPEILNALFQDALPLAKAAGQANGQNWDAANYEFYTLLTSGGYWGYGGLAKIGGRASHLNGAGASMVRTASHEFGHNLGLFHANYWRTDSTSPIGRDSIPGGYVDNEEGDEWIEYGHKFSIMSGQLGRGDLNEGRAHFTTGEKVKLDWLVFHDGDWVSVDRTTTTPIRLYRQDVESEDFGAMLTGVARGIRIDVESGDYAATDKRRYWLSYRRLPTNGTAGDWLPYGLQVDWQRETYGWDGSIQLDMTPYTRDDPNPFHPGTNTDNEDKEDGVVIIGRTYSDEVADIHFTPIAQGGESPNEWIDVLVNIGTQEENSAPEITSFTASSTFVERNEVVDFLVEAEDADGDPLYYTWTFGDNAMVADSLNKNSVSKSWQFTNVYTVRATVSDGKGGSDAKEIHIGVGTNLPAIKGRVVAGGIPVESARINIGSERQAWTDGDGNYALFHWPDRLNRLTAAKEGMRFEPLFSNPVILNYTDVFGKDWVALADGPASGSPQLAVTPHQAEIPTGAQLDFKVLAWNASGKRMETAPVWSVSGGGTISSSGVFTANETGGPFRVTAIHESSQAHALITVMDRIAVGIAALTPQVSEPGLEDAVFRFKRYGGTEGALAVGIRADGSATIEEDYSRFDSNLEFHHGESHKDLTLEIYDDARMEKTENLVLVLQPDRDFSDGHYSIYWAEDSAFIDILDDGDRAPAINVTSPQVALAMVPMGMGLLVEVAVDDDGFPTPPGKSTVTWSVARTPPNGVVFFSNQQGNATVAHFSAPGYYEIKMNANDGVNIASEFLRVYAGLIPDANPSSDAEIVYFTMDETEGITAIDSRGEDNNGALINGASWTGPSGGISGAGIVLDGIDDQINIENADEINLLDHKERTIALWFKAEDPLQETKQVLYEEGGRGSGLNIYLKAGKLYVGKWNYEGDTREETYLSAGLTDANWRHVALVLNAEAAGGSSPAVMKGYLDGLEFGTDITATLLTAHGGNIAIGANRDGTRFHDGDAMDRGFRFSGIVDEFHLWNRALGQFELGQLLSKGYIGPELTLSSVDYSAGSMVVPPGMGIVLDGDASGSSSLETKWETVISPEGGQATFVNSTRPSTFATFSTPGYYKLRFSGHDSIQKTAIDVDVHAGLDAGSNFDSPHEVAYLSMDEGSGEVVGNSADENHGGHLHNPHGWTAEGGGISGSGIQFHNIGQYLHIEPHSPLEATAEKKSFALWIKPEGFVAGHNEVIFRIGELSSGFNIYLDGNMLYFGNWNDGLFSWRTFLAAPITRGKWHHLALVLDADFSAIHRNGLRAYLNGRQVASGPASGMDTINRFPGFGDLGYRDRSLSPTRFHNQHPAFSRSFSFSGLLDEFHYYQDHALTIDEIGMLYAFGNVGPTVDAGPDQSDVPPYSIIQLEGSSTDDGRWSGPVTHSWHILDGPGAGKFRPLEDNSASAQIDLFEGGSYRIALGAYDGQMTTFDELTVTVIQPTQFELFMRDFPAIAVDERGYDADPDGDHRTNLTEYALGGAPDVSETYYQLGLQHELVMEAGDWYAEFRYPRRRDAAQRGLNYEFQVSDDLSAGSWMDRGYTVLNITPIDEVFEEVHLRMDEPLDSANSRLFGRVRVEIRD